MIKVQNFCHQYSKSVEVVNNVSFETKKGDIFGFIGPNGAGKTTTIRFLATLLQPSSGKAWIQGINVSEQPEQVREIIGYVPDQFGVYDGMRVREYLDFFALAYGMDRKQRQRVTVDVMKLVDLYEKRDFLAQYLSRGMRQRLGLARALLHDPPVLILDEPASGLDPRGRIEIMELLKELQKMGKTILVSSHILNEIASYCNLIGIIESGRMVALGTLNEILQSVAAPNKIKLTVVNNPQQALPILQKSSHISDIELQQQHITFSFSGTPEQLVECHRQLLQQQVPVLYMQEVVWQLEDVFMHLTQGKVQ